MRLTMLCLSGFELYSRWVPLTKTSGGGHTSLTNAISDMLSFEK